MTDSIDAEQAHRLALHFEAEYGLAKGLEEATARLSKSWTLVARRRLAMAIELLEKRLDSVHTIT